MKYLISVQLLFLITACTSWNRSEQRRQFPQTMKQQDILKEACITSQGRGKLNLGPKSYAFHYESKWVVTGLTWALSLEVPLRGEESLLLTKKQHDVLVESDQFFVTGSLAQQLDETILGEKSQLTEAQKRQHKEQTDQLLELLGHFLHQWYQFQRASLAVDLDQVPGSEMSFPQLVQLSREQGIEISLIEAAQSKLLLHMGRTLKGQNYLLEWSFINRSPKKLQERAVFFDEQRLVLSRVKPVALQGQDEPDLQSMTLELYPQECFF